MAQLGPECHRFDSAKLEAADESPRGLKKGAWTIRSAV